MLFNSYLFILIFLPITLIGFFTIGKRGHHRIAISWLVGASLFFYGWWNPKYLGLILGSILFNYSTGVALGNHTQKLPKSRLLFLGVSVNLGLLGYFKYSNFFVNQLNWALGSGFHLQKIILPLAISFFTFQQITYLVDAYKGETREYNFLHYCLFVTFFPQLIAGPIVHHKEMLPQFAKNKIYSLNFEHIAVGITIFSIGLFKKVILADGVSEYATPIFNAAEQGVFLTFFEAWGGALAYTFQLYFDFSGYSDMAIGLARMFGILLPLNFNSPYKAVNIIEFWRSWHITLSRFLKDYLYIPLGGNRKGKVRRYINIMITMLLGGLWHGAGWTFVLWGALHGVYLIVNNFWQALRHVSGFNGSNSWVGRSTARMVTFIAVVAAWVVFRAESFNGAMSVLSSMAGVNGISMPSSFAGKLSTFEPWLMEHGFIFNGMFSHELGKWASGIEGMKLLVFLTFIVWYMPNTQQIMIHFKPAFETRSGEVKEWSHKYLKWKPSVGYALFTALVLYFALINLVKESEFLYFNF